MKTITETIDVDAPLRQVYNQWTQFEQFPRFMKNVTAVKQLSDTTLSWTTHVGGAEQEFLTNITAQEPDARIVWSTTMSETSHGGQVSFQSLSDNATRVIVSMDIDPNSTLESVGSFLGFDELAVRRDLKNFKSFAEEEAAATGAWRGTIRDGIVVDDPSPRTFKRRLETTSRK